MGDLPAAKTWVRLEVPVAKLKLAPGTMIDGWAFTQFGGTVYWDRAGIDDRGPPRRPGLSIRSPRGFALRRPVPGRGLPANVKAIVELDRAKRTEAQTKELRAYFHRDTRTPRPAPSLRAVASQAGRGRAGRASSSTTRSRRPSFFVKKPESPSRRSCSSEANTTSAAKRSAGPCPPSCRRFPPGAPVNRLGLAQWLIAPNHPLTARVAVNRFWLQVFGTGIVKTAEDFGAQGEPPSPPRAPRLAGGPVSGRRLGRQAVHETAGDVGHVSSSRRE